MQALPSPGCNLGLPRDSLQLPCLTQLGFGERSSQYKHFTQEAPPPFCQPLDSKEGHKLSRRYRGDPQVPMTSAESEPLFTEPSGPASPFGVQGFRVHGSACGFSCKCWLFDGKLRTCWKHGLYHLTVTCFTSMALFPLVGKCLDSKIYWDWSQRKARQLRLKSKREPIAPCRPEKGLLRERSPKLPRCLSHKPWSSSLEF